jgi:hypothetical protein
MRLQLLSCLHPGLGWLTHRRQLQSAQPRVATFGEGKPLNRHAGPLVESSARLRHLSAQVSFVGRYQRRTWPVIAAGEAQVPLQTGA